MLTRSKVKMQESVRQVHQDLPYFNQEEQRTQTFMYRPSKNTNHSKAGNNYTITQEHYQTDFLQPTQLTHTSKNGNYSRNQILKELRQEYEILKNLSVDDNINISTKKYEYQDGSKLSESSSVSSSVHSKKQSKLKQSERNYGTPKISSKQLQTIHLEKKQLEIVIGNSMRKIQELLNNEIMLKKTIHELKNQVEGKGGVHQEYEKTIKILQKNIDELQEELKISERQNEKSAQKVKDLADRIRFLQGQLANKDRQIKQGFDQQKRLHDLIRIQKDKYLNLQIQCKTYKMEFDLLEKEKNNEMNRLIRQFESKQGGNEKQMAYIIKRLEDQIKEKDKKYHDLLVEKEQIKREKERQVVDYPDKRNDKNYLEELMYKSRQINQTNNRALTDSMNLIFAKMAELQKKNDVTLKRQIQALKKKTQDNKRNTNEADLLARITELQKMIEREISEKTRLAEDIKGLKEHKYELEDKNRLLDKKLHQLEQREQQLKEEIEHLEQIKQNFNSTSNDHRRLQEQTAIYSQKIRSLQIEVNNHQQYVNSLNLSFKEKQKKYEDQIRILRRKVDEADFQAQKLRKEAELNLSMLKSSSELEIKAITEEKNRLSQRLKQVQLLLSGSQADIEAKLKAKQQEIANLKSNFETLRLKQIEQINNQQRFYADKATTIENSHSLQIKRLNDKFAAIALANEQMMGQIATYRRMEAELIEIRRALKQTRTVNSNINHLWEIKQAEYSNLHQILSSINAS